MKYAYINGKILDGTKDMQVKEGFVILTDNDKIEDIVKAGTDLNGYEKVDLKRRYIMPGLINMHVHLAGNGKPQKKQRDNEKLVKILMGNALMRSIAYGMVAGFAKTELMSGVTTIRTVGGLGSFDTKLRDEINAGTKMGPRILAANEGISVPGGHMAGSVAVAADSIDTALKHLEQSEKEKVDLIKLMITGGVMDAKEKGVPGELKMSPEMVKVVCDKAHENGYLVAALVRICVGSATVAMTMAAGIVAAMPEIASLSPMYLACVVAAVAGGATVCSHFNDSGFWLVRSLIGLDEKTTLKTWTIMETLVGGTGFIVALIISFFV